MQNSKVSAIDGINGRDSPSESASAADKAKGVIARKVINFLKLVEDRTAHAKEA